MKNILLLSFLFLTTALSAQYTLPTEVQKNFYQAFIQNDPTIWESNIQVLEKEYETTKDLDLLYEITNAYYGLAGTYMGKDDKVKAEETVNKTLTNIELLIKEQKESDKVHALQAGIFGMQMGFNPMSGMTLGPKSSKHLNKSLKLKEDSPQGNYQMGGSYLYTPAMFGGSTKKAIEYYTKSVEAFEAQGNLNNNWEYLRSVIWLGIAYKKYEDFDQAKTAFEKALALEPTHQWVKTTLLPSVQKG